MKPHAFVAMPFGIKPDVRGNPVDFNRVYADLIKPALEDAGLSVFRADEEMRAGDIRADMFQELLMADLVVADLSIDNPNVWYELGVRHALRARGVILVQGPRDTQPFDSYTERKLRYHTKDGVPDADFLAADRKAIADMARHTMDAWHGRKVSPVYALLPNLTEPDWKRLKVGAAREFWVRFDAWAALVERAQRAGRPEDILVLADEGPVAALRVEARLKAGAALRAGCHFKFALEQFELALDFDPQDREAARQRGICLQRTGRGDEARRVYRGLLDAQPDDAETWSLLGRLDKDAWVGAWRRVGGSCDDMRADALADCALLGEAIASYAAAFRAQPAHYYSGINAVTLMQLHRHLTGDSRLDAEMEAMAGGIAWAARCETNPKALYWARATLADLAVLRAEPDAVRAAYLQATACSDKDGFELDSTLSQLRLLADLGFRPESVAAGIAVLERAAGRLQRPGKAWQPDRVFLFSGHMVDAPGRAVPRFPADQVPVAAVAIADALIELGAREGDLALTQGAAGGDLLFAQACIERGMRVQLLLPLAEPAFIQASILPSADGETWRKRYHTLRANPLCLPPRVMPDVLGPPPADGQGGQASPFERCNLWLLNTALTTGIDKTHFICLWNGGGGDGPGGTAHMVAEVKRRTGQVTWLDTRRLW